MYCERDIQKRFFKLIAVILIYGLMCPPVTWAVEPHSGVSEPSLTSVSFSEYDEIKARENELLTEHADIEMPQIEDKELRSQPEAITTNSIRTSDYSVVERIYSALSNDVVLSEEFGEKRALSAKTTTGEHSNITEIEIRDDDFTLLAYEYDFNEADIIGSYSTFSAHEEKEDRDGMEPSIITETTVKKAQESVKMSMPDNYSSLLAYEEDGAVDLSAGWSDVGRQDADREVKSNCNTTNYENFEELETAVKKMFDVFYEAVTCNSCAVSVSPLIIENNKLITTVKSLSVALKNTIKAIKKYESFVKKTDDEEAADIPAALKITKTYSDRNNSIETIKREIAVLIETRKSAINEFFNNISPYYSELDSMLKKVHWLWEEQGIDPHFYYRGADGVVNAEELREVVQEAVDYLYKNVPYNTEAQQMREEIIALEEKLRSEFIEPSLEIYETEIKKASSEFYKSIQEKIEMLTGPYISNANGTLEVIIVLPKEASVISNDNKPGEFKAKESPRKPEL